MLVSTSSLSRGERLRIARRRRGFTQARAAQQYEVPVAVYRSWEVGEDSSAPDAAVGALAEHEQCWVLRLRSRKTLEELREEVNLCGYWLSMMEKGKVPCRRLVDFWRRAA
jgi:transcriptional regulator with XRE-family HTH domain